MNGVDMRTLGLALVIASLLLGSGGVAYRTQAGEANEQFGLTLAEPEAAPEPLYCEEPPTTRMRLPRRTSGKHVINLSNRGHNYRSGPAKPADSLPASARN